MDLQERMQLISSVGEEVLTQEELKQLLETNNHPIAYDGFEPSGRLHIAQGLMRTTNINKMMKAGCKFKLYIADWHAWANNKFGGDLEKINIAGEYFIEVWKACGLQASKIDFVKANDVVGDRDYWKKVMKIATSTTVNRMLRCGQIMGRSEGEMQYASQILYPCMQAADVFHFDIDICQLGMDQRKVNILARELAPKLGYKKAVAVHTHMLMGLSEPPTSDLDPIEQKIAMKMSKSKPDTAIFMDDPEEEVVRKIKKAYCPEQQVELNPMIEYAKYIIFENVKKMKVERPQKFGGDLEIEGFDELCKIYSAGELHPMDLKNAVTKYTNEFLAPVREHFEKNKKAKELYETVKQYAITR
jgi:tyrosyl-tRNA synthetase